MGGEGKKKRSKSPNESSLPKNLIKGVKGSGPLPLKDFPADYEMGDPSQLLE